MILPWCEVCGHTVDSLRVEQDWVRQWTKFTVTCHGKGKVYVMSDLELYTAKDVDSIIDLKLRFKKEDK